MIRAAMSGGPAAWQTILADLSLILFLVTASAIEAEDLPFLPGLSAPSTMVDQQPIDPGDPSHALAVWRAGPQAPALAEWLAAQPVDARVSVLVLAHYPPGARAAAWQEADALAQAAQQSGHLAGITLLPGAARRATVSLLYDGAADPPANPSGNPSGHQPGAIGPELAVPLAN